jgi:CarD family transcriptional regulator
MAKSVFKVSDKVVYPTHGVGLIRGLEGQEIGGQKVELLVVAFEKDKMTLRIPLTRAQESGLRKLSSNEDLDRVRKTLRSRAKISRGMWSRRAKEYESKINSGCIVSLAEVVRDLHKNVDDPDRSYSERVIYENALNRLVGEFAAIENIDHDQATKRVLNVIRVA